MYCVLLESYCRFPDPCGHQQYSTGTIPASEVALVEVACNATGTVVSLAPFVAYTRILIVNSDQ